VHQAGLLQQQGQAATLPVYHLVAASHHSGSLEGGHYTAVGRSAADGRWYNFNDSSVRQQNVPGGGDGGSNSAYVLFYRLSNAS
jgi:ubiquitin C-terminal hydrolase